MEFDSLAKGKGIGEVIRIDFPAFRKHWNDLLIFIKCHELLVHGAKYRHGQRVGNLMRVQRLDIQVKADHKVLIRRSGLRLPGCRAPLLRSR